MELHKEDPPSSSPPLSGAYIRSLVKQLKTSKPKETTNTKDPSQNLRKNVKNQQQKKQVRRRLHTSKPYQERLLNMAEARKEIVTALKFHRAAMKQATEEQRQQQQQQQQQRRQQEQESLVASFYHPSSHFSSFEQDVKSNSRRNPRIYPSCTSNFSNDFSYSSLLVPNSYTSFASPLVVGNENSNFTIPNQTLGLNLNLHDFNNLDATLLNNNNNNSSSTSSSSPPLSIVTDQDAAPDHLPVVASGASPDFPTDVQSIGKSQGEGVSSIMDTMNDEVMEEMRLLGEQYQMELNDTINLVTSTWWFNFLKNMEHDEIALQVNSEDDALNHHVFDELNAEESCFEQWSEDYFQYLNLPW